MNNEVPVFVLLAHLAVIVVCNGFDYSYCPNYASYNTLANLMKRDECLNVDSVFKLLVEISEHSVSCREHIINLLADHFEPRGSAPDYCQCQGVNKLQAYHQGPGDGVSNERDVCIKNDHSYRDLYYQFFESSNSSNHAIVCRTHHSVWSALRNISSSCIGSNSCQKDIIFHLKYAFDHNHDNCSCTGYDYSYCTNYASYNTLANLMKRDECLNVNSVFKLLVEISEHSVSCRVHIISLLADHFEPRGSAPDYCQCQGVNKLQAYHQGPGDGVSNERDVCIKNDHSYRDLYYQFFESPNSNNHADACRTHHSVWSALRNISSSCIGSNSCQKDIIFHLKYAFDQHPDNCSCTGYDYSYCTNYTSYNTLANLKKRDECLNVDSVFKLLVEISEHSVSCREHIINLLADHFGPRGSTPDHCQCQGKNKLQAYHQGPGDGVSNERDVCIKNDHSYRDLYYQFFESSHNNNNAGACRTHHSVWSVLGDISSSCIGSNSCQKDIIFHLKYAFDQHHDDCSCTEATHHPDSQESHEHDKCYHYDSFHKLMQLGETDGCLSSNSAWHYLDDLQAKDPDCRKRIQKHLADKYEHRQSQHSDNCICHERRHLVNQEIHRMDNGSFHECRDVHESPYGTIETDLFSNIRAHGCQNHNYLWHKLNGVKDYCSRYNNNRCTNLVDCQQDLIVRAAIQYPKDDSDSCVCSQITSSTVPSMPTASTKVSTPLTTTSTTLLATPSTTPLANSSTTPLANPSTTHLANPSTTHLANPSTTLLANLSTTPLATPAITPLTNSSTIPLATPSTTPLATPSTTPSTTPLANPSTTPLATPSTTPLATPSTTPTTEQPASATSVRVTRRSTTVMSTQRTTPTLKFTCDKLRVVEDIAKSLKATDPNSSYCNPDAGGSDDAYVLSTCNMTSPMTWKKGENVLADCMSSTQLIPTYTPISTFDGDNYAPLGALSGIFLGCYNTGIKIAIQRCNRVPEIVHIENGSFAYNPKNYYLIV